MAHPLTQQPPSSLPFHFAARPSPLGFGFGVPSAAPSPNLSTYTPSRPSGLATPNWQTSSPSSSSKTLSARQRPTPYSIASTGNLKRSRRTRSPSSSPPNSPTDTNTLVRVHSNGENGLALRDEAGVSTGAKHSKRARAENAIMADSNNINVDVGVMLATLPPSAHLPILLHVLRAHPSLSDLVLSQMPPLDSRACLNELQTVVDRIEKQIGQPIQTNDLSFNIREARRWERVRDDIATFCITASTYLNHTRSQSRQPLSSPQSMFTLLQFVTTHLGSLLRLVPSYSFSRPEQQIADRCHIPLELAKALLSMWTEWISELSADVNQRGGMYPHSLVTAWLDTLDGYASQPLQTSSSLPSQSNNPHWSFSVSDPAPTSPLSSEPFVDQFRSALEPIRDKFVSDIGWLVGR